MVPLFCPSLCPLQFSVGILNSQDPPYLQFDVSQPDPSTTYKTYFPVQYFCGPTDQLLTQCSVKCYFILLREVFTRTQRLLRLC
jgi:hypothetical protein